MRLRSFLVVANIVFLVACSGSAVDAVNDAVTNPDAGDASTNLGDGGGVDEAGAKGSDAATSPIDIKTDSKNCGAIGHDCLGASCAGGLCAPATVRTHSGWFAIDGGNMYVFTSDTMLSVVPTDGSSAPSAFATLDKSCVSSIRELYVTPSYVVLQCANEIQTVDKSTHAIATITFPVNGSPWATVVGNDTALYWYDANPYIWSVPTAGGTPTQAFYHWIPTSLMGTGDGMLALVSDGIGQPYALYHFKNGATLPTFVADTSDDSTPAIITTSPTLAFGATQDESDPNVCETGGGTSTFWSAPRAGGSETTIATLPFRAGQMLGDAAGVVIADQCQNISGASYTGDRNVWSVPTTSGGTPFLLALTTAATGQIGIDSTYVYFTDRATGDIVRTPR